MGYSKLVLYFSVVVLFCSNNSFGQIQKNPTPVDTGTGKVPGAPETPPQRAIEINADDQKFNDSLLNARGDANATDKLLTPAEQAKKNLRDKIFGSAIFSNKNLKFDANLNMSTPVDYHLGAGDELNIELYGYSQATYKLKVQPDGYIVLGKDGLVIVNGLTIEEAKERIKNKLSKTHVGLLAHDGYSVNTYLNVSLGNIRTIRVSVIGEVVNPGTFSLSSLSTIMTALYQAGGPNEIGSYRNVHLIRNNKVAAKIDLYDFLIKGIKGNDVHLQEQDRILVNHYDTRVEFEGEVKKPGIYEVVSGENLDKAIEFAGGFTENAYSNKLKVIRNTDREKKILDAKNEEFSGFKLYTGDKIFVEKILERFENQVNINGAVFRPGQYSLDSNPTILTLIKNAEGAREDAYLQKVRIIRLKSDLTISTITINLAKILNGEEPDVKLQREDRIEVTSNFDLKEIFTVGIRGEINKVPVPMPVEAIANIPAPKLELEKAPFYNDMKLSDLIMFAKGLKESAAGGSIDVTRRKKKSGALDDQNITTELGQTYTFHIKSNLRLDEKDENFPLEPFDEVFVRASPNYETQQFITVTGQVVKQGPYGLLRKDERISDVIKRCGGPTEFAFIEGATLVRENKLTALELETKRKQLAAIQNTKNAKLEVDEVNTVNRERISIDLAKAINNPGSDFDQILQDGDVLNIPKFPQTVKLSGEVLYPNTTQFEGNYGFTDYISRAGGFTSESMKRKSYILYANGSVDRTKKFLLFNLYPKVRPGSEIIVPQKAKKTTLGEIFGAFGGIAQTLGALVTSYLLIKSLKKTP
jgi:protein involved in polysaccharide export with SLBB domain